MDHFDIIEVNSGMYGLIVIMKTNEPPFDYLQEISDYLKARSFKGAVLIDQLVAFWEHTGTFYSWLF